MKIVILMAVVLATSISLGAEVVLTFGDSEDFTDFEYAHIRRTVDTEFFSENIVSRLNSAVENVFPEGAVLTLDFQDIDLAGGFEPWQRIPRDDVRMYKYRYPPSAEFSYRLVDNSGDLIAEGDAKLKDLGYLDRYSRRKGVADPFYYEWRMLERWIKTNLHKAVESES